MLKEFFDSLAGYVKAAETPRILTWDTRANIVHLEDGKYVFKRRVRGPVKDHLVYNLQSFADLAKWAVDEQETSSPYVFVSLECAEFYYDSADREDKIEIRLPLSEQYKTLININKKLLSQKEFVKALRIDLDGTLSNQVATIDKFSAVKWSTEDSSESVVARGKSSLGKQITQQFTGVGETPDTLTFTVPMYESRFNSKAVLKFDVEPDVTSRGFVLTAYPSQFANAEKAATEELQSHIIGLLEDQDILVVVGSEGP